MPQRFSTGRVGQALALGLTLVIPALLWLAIAQPLIAWHQERADALSQRHEILGRMQALVATLPALQQHVSTLTSNGTHEPALLAGENDATASAMLQEKLQEILAQSGAKLNSIETFPGEDAGALRRVRLQLSLNASWPVLIALLHKINESTPVMLVDELQIQPAMHRISTASGTFDINCSVFSFRSASATQVVSR